MAQLVRPPQFVGTAAVAAILDLTAVHVRALLAAQDPRVTAGYVGKISGRHCWNLDELFAAAFVNRDAYLAALDETCGMYRCNRLAVGETRLCWNHLLPLASFWKRDSGNLERLVAMCAWVVDQHPEITLREGVCVCGDPSDRPLCDACLSALKGLLPIR